MPSIIHLDPEMLKELGIQLLNTAILCFILAKLLYIPVKEFLFKRARRVAGQIDDAQKMYNDAALAKEEYQKKLADIDKERAEILDNARDRAAEKEAQIVETAKHEAELIRTRAQLEISRAQDAARDEVRRQMIEVSMKIAGRYILEKMDENTQRRLLDEAVASLGESEWLS